MVDDESGNHEVTHRAGCHCGGVRIEFEAAAEADVLSCNCSMCHKLGYLHLIVEKGRLRLITPEEHIETYRFNTGVAQHYFCKTCGVKPFYVPRSHPDKYSVNVRCIEGGTFTVGRVVDFDGQHWEKAYEDLKGD